MNQFYLKSKKRYKTLNMNRKKNYFDVLLKIVDLLTKK